MTESVKPKFFPYDVSKASQTQALTFYIVLPPLAAPGTHSIVIFQLVYSTMNSWSHTIQSTIRLYEKNIKQTVSSYSADFLLREDQVECGGMKIKRISSGKFECYFKSELVEMQFTMQGDERTFGTGTFNYKNGEGAGYLKSSIVPSALVKGSYKCKNVERSFDCFGTAISAIQYLPQQVSSWSLLILAGTEGINMVVYQFEADEKHSCQGVLIEKGLMTEVSNVMTGHNKIMDDWSGYPIPSQISHRAQSIDNKVSIMANLGLTKLIDKIDVLAELPYLVKSFIQKFVSCPYVYQWGENATYKVERNGVIKEVKGWAFQETSYL